MQVNMHSRTRTMIDMRVLMMSPGRVGEPPLKR